MALKAGDHLGAGLLIGPHHYTEIFRIELCRERRRADQVTEQHGELTPFRLWWRGGSRRRGRLECRLGRRWERGGRRCSIPCPDEDAAVLVARQVLGVNEFDLEVVEIRIV
jgi:hypothetical protein